MKKVLVVASVVLASTLAFAQSATTSSTGATIATPVATAQPTAKKWSGSAFVGNWGNLDKAVSGDETNNFSSTDYFVEAKRDIGNNQSLALRVNAIRYATSDENNDKFQVADPQIFYRNKAFQSTVRLSLPVTDYAREVGRHELRYNGGMDLYQAGKFTASLLIEGRAYAYTSDSDGQRRFRTRDGFGFTYDVTDRIQPFFNAQYDVRWANSGRGISLTNINKKSDPKNLARMHWLDLGATFTLVPKTLEMNLYATQVRDADSATELFEQSETDYNVEFMARF